jgi:lysophospholipid acyltransferase (LPLAT)-like uncharacterized protein
MKSVAALAIGVMARLLARSWRLEVVGERHVEQARGAGGSVIFAVWHAFMLVPLWHRRGQGVTLLVSAHEDAAYLARAAMKWGYSVVRGSTTRGGASGFLGIVRVLSSGGEVAFTPDGPKGPARIAKPGAVAAAAQSGAAIVPIGASASSWWRLRSWDRFAIPRPFSRVRLVYGAPFRPNGTRAAAGKEETDQLTERLNAVQRSAGC